MKDLVGTRLTHRLSCKADGMKWFPSAGEGWVFTLRRQHGKSRLLIQAQLLLVSHSIYFCSANLTFPYPNPAAYSSINKITLLI